MADDIGEALDLGVGLAQVRRALVDDGFQIDVGIAQPRLGVIARLRRAPHQPDRDHGKQHDQAGADARHGCGEGLALVRARRAEPEQPFLLADHCAGDAADGGAGVAGGGLAGQRRGLVRLALFDEVDLALELVEADIDRRAELLDAVALCGIVADQPRQLVERRNDRRDGLVMIGLEFGALRQQVAAQGALGAPDFEQHGVDLVLHLDGVNHPFVVVARLVDEIDRAGADHGQHQKPRREQQDLPERAPPPRLGRHDGSALSGCLSDFVEFKTAPWN